MSRMSSKVEQTTYDDFLKMTKSELEDFLAPRNLSCSGSKRELVARAFTAWELKIPIRISDEELQAKLRDEYNNRLKKHNLKDPKVYEESDWKKDVSQWPLVDLGKIFEYVLDNREFGSDYIGKYKTQKAYSYFKSGFVSCIECVVDPELNGTIILRARVTPSQSVRDIPREIWIAAKASGQTLTAWCSCTAGYGQTCNHVISVLYKVEFAISNEYNEPSCTEKSSKWNDQTYRQVQPKKIKEMDIRSDNRLTNTDYDGRQTKRMSKLNFDPRRAGEDSVNETAIGSFLTGLSKISPQSVLFTGLSWQIGSQSLKQLPPTLIETAETITAKGGATCDEDETRQFFETIKLDDGQVKKIEETTRAQRDSEDWKNQRLGKITASMCHTVHTKVKSMLRKPTKKQKVSPLVAEIVYGGPALDHLEAIKWGVEHEQDAKEAFYRSVSPNHRNFSIKQCGLHVHKDMPYIAASPDGIAVCDCCDRSVIEFKCPFKIRGKTVHEAYKETDFLEEVDGALHLKTTHKYFTQIQCQMGISKTKTCYFCVWTGEGIPFIESIKFDQSFWDEVEQNIIFFYKNNVVKVLLGHKTIFYCPECKKLCLDDGEIELETENVVCCDKCDMWFHWGCVGFSSMMLTSDFVCKCCQ